MSEQIIIQSKLKNYSLEFVNDVFPLLEKMVYDGSFVIIDSSVYELFHEKFKSFLRNDFYLLIQATEFHKSYDYCGKVINELINKKIRKNCKLVAIGGGIIQDISAFVASILFRGLDWSFIPTTLLAQADSCIGGKTSINFGEVKNTIGNFNPPTKIYIDLVFLNSLQVDDIKSGIGEILHFYFYNNSHMLDRLVDNYNDLLRNRAFLKEHIMESLRIKKSVIEVDEFDKDERNKFNYGHTFGHALESVTHYSVKHGQAVTIGMDIANLLSVKLGLLDEATYNIIHKKLKINFPDYDLTTINVEKYVSFLSRDKKNTDDQLVCILSEGKGKLVKKKIIADREIKDFLASYFRK